MPVQLLDGSHVVADTQADDAGQWYVSVDLRLGAHTLTARANGLQGNAMSRRYPVAG
jgi:hypothetical protein